MLNAIDLYEKFELVTEHYTPRLIASINGTALKIAKFLGPFTWHAHMESDEIFWVIRGELTILMETPQGETEVAVKENQLFSVPKGVRHKPVAESEAWVALLEPEGTLNTGNINNEFTVREIEKI